MWLRRWTSGSWSPDNAAAPLYRRLFLRRYQIRLLFLISCDHRCFMYLKDFMFLSLNDYNAQQEAWNPNFNFESACLTTWLSSEDNWCGGTEAVHRASARCGGSAI